MRTSAEWYQEVKTNPEKFIEWLKKQYHGELTAADRITDFRDKFTEKGTRWYGLLSTIAIQEYSHACWVGDLLVARNIEPIPAELAALRTERYWSKALDGVTNMEEMAATAAHAEIMRLERINIIVNDPETQDDIKEVFFKILTEEKFHAKAFSEMAGDKAMANRLKNHELGMEAICLIPSDM